MVGYVAGVPERVQQDAVPERVCETTCMTMISAGRRPPTGRTPQTRPCPESSTRETTSDRTCVLLPMPRVPQVPRHLLVVMGAWGLVGRTPMVRHLSRRIAQNGAHTLKRHGSMQLRLHAAVRRLLTHGCLVCGVSGEATSKLLTRTAPICGSWLSAHVPGWFN